MRKSVIILAAIFIVMILALSAYVQAQEAGCKKTCKIKTNKKIGPIRNYILYYGDNPVAALMNEGFDLNIIDIDRQHTPGDISKLRNPICYLSIGEESATVSGAGMLHPNCYLKPDFPGAISESYTYEGKTYTRSLHRGDQGEFTAYFIDVSCSEWQKKIRGKAQELMKKGCKGIFFDTVDTVDPYINSNNNNAINSMVQLMRSVRSDNPSAILIQNRGLNVLDKTHGIIDGVVWENFAAVGGKLTSRDEWFNKKLSETKSYDNLGLLSLDQGNLGDASIEKTSANKAIEDNFLPYVTSTIGYGAGSINNKKLSQCNHVIGSKKKP